MKTLSVLTLLTTVALGVSLNTMANESNHQLIQNQQLSKRPYQAVPDQSQKEEGWEGATYLDSKSNNAASNKSIQQIRLHMLGKRPYMDTQK